MDKRKKYTPRQCKPRMKEKGRILAMERHGKNKNNDDDTSTAQLTDIGIKNEKLDVPADVNFSAQATGSFDEDCADIDTDVKPSPSQELLASPADANDDATTNPRHVLNTVIPHILHDNKVPIKLLDTVNGDHKVHSKAASSEEPWTVTRSLCRCCHAEGDFDPMSAADGDEPPPTDILLHVFDIQLCPTVESGDALRSVCMLCQARLRDAHQFLQQVRACDEHFTWMYSNGRIKVPDVVIEITPVKDEANDSEYDGGAENLVPEEAGRAMDGQKDVKARSAKKRKAIDGQKDVTARSAKKRKAIDGQKDVTARSAKKRLASIQIKTIGATENEEYCKQIGDLFKCVRCSKKAKRQCQIQLHYYSVHIPHPCDRCPEIFQTDVQLKVHKLKKHDIDERYTCNACGKRFNGKPRLKSHMDFYHKLGVKVKCPKCSYETYGNENMNRHLISHTGVRKYQCQFCSKSFVRLKTLDYHQRIHTGDKRKKCAECGQAFVQKASLNYHMAKHHPEVRF